MSERRGTRIAPPRSSQALTGEELAKSLLLRIASGEFPVGTPLPSCRSMASSLGISHSTVNRIYQELEDLGVVKAEQGKGVIVQQLGNADPGRALAELQADLTRLVRRALLLGFSDGEIQEQLSRALLTVQSRHRVPVAFVECYAMDTKVVANALQAQIQDAEICPVELERLRDQPDWFKSFELITTTYYHVAEVEALVPPDCGVEIVVLNHAPSQQSILEVARLPRDSRVLVVAKNERTMKRLVQLLQMYGPPAVAACVAGEEARLKTLLPDSDVIVSTHSSAEVLGRLGSTLPSISVDFRIQPDSIAMLSKQVSEILAKTKECDLLDHRR